ncbi:MAG: TonB-dependent receptor [Xanthomonadales bacterium]|nr:TonB-dependent receptor [Xanthomonadales bacterium]
MQIPATLFLALSLSAERPLEVVQVTASRTERSTFDTAEAVSVMDRQAIGLETPQIAIDAMRGIPGVFVQQTTPGQGIPIVRGLKGSEILHLVDGIRLNNSFFRNAPNQYIALVDVNNIDRIEALRGPASTLYGADAMGGTIQFLTRKPQFGATETALDGFASSADQGFGVSLAHEQGGDRLAWRIQGSYLDIGDRETGSGEISPTGYEARSLNGSIRWLAGETGEWRLDLQHLEQPSTPRVDELVPGFGQAEPDSAEFFFEPNERTFAHLTHSGEATHGWFDQYEVHAAWQRLVDDRRTRGFGSSERRFEANDSDQVGLTAQFQRDTPDGGVLVYGAEFYHDEVASARSALDIATGETRTLQSRFPDGSEQRSAAVYLRHDWLFSWGGFDAGVRYNRFDVDIARGDRETSAELDLSEVTANLGISYNLTEQVNLVANFGEGFRAPNIFDLATLGPRPGNRFNVANSDLSPEKLRSVDFGIKWSTRRSEGEIFAFAARFEDKIDSVATGETTGDGRIIVRSENLAEVDLHGIEAGLRRELGAAGQLWAAVNYTQGTEKQPDGAESPADRVPPLSGEIGYRHDFNTFTAEAFSRFARRQDRLSDRDVRDPRINPDGTPGWGTLNLRVRYDLNPTWQIVGAVENLADRTYREHGSGIDAPGRNLKLSLSGRW